MALALTRDLTDIDEVAASCYDVYERRGEVADLMSWNRLFLGESITEQPPTPTVVVRSTRTIECVLPHGADPAMYVTGFRRMVSEDWAVRVLVHSAEMGRAHVRLRGSPVTIQAWWFDGGRVGFGRPEIP